VPDNGAYVGVGENPFAGRAPDFFQTDIRFVKHWVLSQRVGMEAFLDVQNVTAQANVDTESAGGSGGKPTLPAVSGAMPFFPSLGLSVTF